MPVPSSPLLRADPRGTILSLRVIPRAGRTAFAGVRGDALLVRLAAAPVDGAANEALIDFLAASFHLPRRRFTLISGATARDKRILCHDAQPADVSRWLAKLL